MSVFRTPASMRDRHIAGTPGAELRSPYLSTHLSIASFNTNSPSLKQIMSTSPMDDPAATPPKITVNVIVGDESSHSDSEAEEEIDYGTLVEIYTTVAGMGPMMREIQASLWGNRGQIGRSNRSEDGFARQRSRATFSARTQRR
ncbi:hypothetical protein FA95DRAFT_1560698 [Auriscalpium vulgare]|uniref:Uncharacterized protein n=1 Tax=Auriscalpium vulgare TaxID=40419 RepID=A0ACB8RP74_9AGAM|nr:hypothetical protein FA95DRAFT_1560698 [Auriscalpium vulgare]